MLVAKRITGARRSLEHWRPRYSKLSVDRRGIEQKWTPHWNNPECLTRACALVVEGESTTQEVALNRPAAPPHVKFPID